MFWAEEHTKQQELIAVLYLKPILYSIAEGV